MIYPQSLITRPKFEVAFWGLTYVFGRNDMYWYRLTQNLGRNSLVGTTIKDPDHSPEHVLADEKHTDLNGEKAASFQKGHFARKISLQFRVQIG